VKQVPQIRLTGVDFPLVKKTSSVSAVAVGTPVQAGP
jgi:hypothetical protein